MSFELTLLISLICFLIISRLEIKAILFVIIMTLLQIVTYWFVIINARAQKDLEAKFR